MHVLHQHPSTRAEHGATWRAAFALRLVPQAGDDQDAALSHCVAAVSHGLRQPLQTLTLLHDMLAGVVLDERARVLVARFDETLNAMTATLDALVAAAPVQSHVVAVTAVPAGDAPLPLAGLSPRQMEVMTRVLDGHASKIIAADLGISRRTVENHRAAIMKKTGASSLPALARLALAAPATRASPP